MNMQPGFTPRDLNQSFTHLYAGPVKASMNPLLRRRSFIENIASIASALKATYVVTLNGTVLVDHGITSQNTEEPAALSTVDGVITALDARVMSQLRMSLDRLHFSDLQFISGKNLESMIALRKIVIHDEPLIFIREARNAHPSLAEIQEFGRPFSLTKTECSVVQALSSGKSPEAVSEQLNVAMSTIRTHIKNILSKTSSVDVRKLLMSVGQVAG
jgi:DNA-binding CsgD family transcriptional regulator